MITICTVHFIHLTLEMKMFKSFEKLKAYTKSNSFNLVRLSTNSIKGRPKDKHFKSSLKVKKEEKIHLDIVCTQRIFLFHCLH